MYISDCGCYRPGTVGSSVDCDIKTGQCVCKTYTITRRCDRCKAGTYNLHNYNVFGCKGQAMHI